MLIKTHYTIYLAIEERERVDGGGQLWMTFPFWEASPDISHLEGKIINGSTIIKTFYKKHCRVKKVRIACRRRGTPPLQIPNDSGCGCPQKPPGPSRREQPKY